MYSLIAYNEYVPTIEVRESPVVKYYADMWAQLVSPLGFIPDYGDWDLGVDWIHLAAVMEKCASEYKSPTLKYAVNRYAAVHIENHTGLANGITRFMRQFIAAYEWADDELEERIPSTGNQPACDDTIAKKCVFRDGWEPGSTYLMLNYRDECPADEIVRKSLPMTIPVKAEKTHHGHNDENSICMLVAHGRILLTESGYRRNTKRDCAYRSDYFHNKLVIRKGVNREHSFFDQIVDYGEYNPVSTERVFYHRFDEVDCSRTRVRDRLSGATCDRVVYFFKQTG